MRFFIDLRPARDEYVGSNIGLFIFTYCLLGIFLWINHPKSKQIGIILFNHAFGIWFGEDAKEASAEDKSTQRKP